MTAGMTLSDVLWLLGATLAITLVGHRLAGHVSDRRGFFQGNQSLPWWAVSSSIIATVISSVTFVSVPAYVFKPGGDLGYFQILLGLMLGKVLTALLFARPFYESTGIQTTYDYIGGRTHPAIGQLSMGLGLLLAIINAALKVLTASLVLNVVTGWTLSGCVLGITAFAALWSALSGVKTVIWTDLLLFVIFTGGAVMAIFWTADTVTMSIADAVAELDARAKLTLFDFSVDPAVSYTLWAGLIGASLLSLAMAANQGTYQRVRACRSVADARRAYLYSAIFYLTPLCMLVVGLLISVFYVEHPLPADVLESLSSEPDRIFPYFIVTEIPHGLATLLIAAIFAAGISTLDTSLTEVADVTVNNLYARYLRPRASEREYVLAGRLSLVFWSVLFAATALFFSRFSAEGLLDLTFKLPNYLNGAMLATVLLARFAIGGVWSYLAGFAAAAMTVAWLAANGVGFFWWCPASALTMIATVWALHRGRPEWRGIYHARPLQEEA
ncbi:MAG: hypothetical protein R3E86_17635 [Pseudomonadales bacterium]